MQYQRNQGVLRRCRSALDAVSDDQPVIPLDLTLDVVIVVMTWTRTCLPGPPLVASKGGPGLPSDGGEWVAGLTFLPRAAPQGGSWLAAIRFTPSEKYFIFFGDPLLVSFGPNGGRHQGQRQ